MQVGQGRPRTPVAIREKQGNPGHRTIPPEPAYRNGEPKKPKFLSARALEIWDEEKGALVAAGVLKTNHGAAFGAYCQTIADFEEVRKTLEVDGMTTTDRFGHEKPHALLDQYERLRRMIYVGAGQFGCTAAAGSKVAAIEGKPGNEFAGLEIAG